MRAVLLYTLSLLVLSGVTGILSASDKSPVSGTATCTSAGCHAEMLSYATLHKAAEDDCESCHDAGEGDHPGQDGPEFTLADDVPELCYTCHDEKNTRAVVHDPVAEGDCLSCHSPHGSDEPKLLEEPAGSLCETCHDQNDEAAVSKHGPVSGGECIACHNPHESDLPRLLKQRSPELCLGCHEEQQAQTKLSSVHDAFEDDCLNCHEPHAASNSPLLSDAVPQLCFDCHDDIEDSVDNMSTVHEPLNDEASCLSCHSPHASDSATLLDEEPPDLCFNCHDRRANEKIRAVEEKVRRGVHVHPPAADGECVDCHEPHGSDVQHLLSSAFPGGHYAVGDVSTFALCFDCHDEDLLNAKSTTTATEFRDGDRNLHYVHVNREKGRSCVLCHDAHGSDFPHMIAGKVPFGDWQLPLNYLQTSDGGSCAPGCHEERSYHHKDDE